MLGRDPVNQPAAAVARSILAAVCLTFVALTEVGTS